MQPNPMSRETKLVSGLSDGAAKLWRRSRSPHDLFLILVLMIESGEIDVIEAMLIVRELRQKGLVVGVIDAESHPQFQWAAGAHRVN